ncbi:MAG: amidohydrolase family protein [Pseudomonadota bacterium]
MTAADTLITNTILITMNAARDVLTHAAIAWKEGRIVWVGSAADATKIDASTVIDGRDKVIAPGFINAHVHITGDPLTRHYMPDDLTDENKLMAWVMPRYSAHTPEDETLSALYCSLELMKAGCTTFLEAGTVAHLGHAIEGVRQAGIRARMSSWIEGRAFDPSQDESALIDDAIKAMEAQAKAYPNAPETLVSAWPILVGHNTNPDAVWQAAKDIAKSSNAGVAAHMSPYDSDGQWYLREVGKRPIEHLEDLGVLDPDTTITHATYLSDAECDAFVRTKANIAFCPFATLKGGFGAAKAGRYAQLRKRGVNIAFATDGYDTEILQAARIGLGLYKDIEADVTTMGAVGALEAITIHAAKALGMESEIGSLEVGKQADVISFDTKHIQWRPLLSPLDQLIWAADGRSLDSVWVAGQQRIAGGKSVDFDEEELFVRVEEAAKGVIERSGLPFKRDWSMRPA